MKWWSRLIITVAVLLPTTIAPAMLLWFLGHQPYSWYSNADTTTCLIVSTYETEDVCSDGGVGCGGGEYYYGAVAVSEEEKRSVASRACGDYTCYDWWVVVNHTLNGVEYSGDAKVNENYSTYMKKPEEYKYLDQEYPVGSKIKCWYNESDPSDIRIAFMDIYLIFFYVFISICGFVLLIHAIVELANAICSCCD